MKKIITKEEGYESIKDGTKVIIALEGIVRGEVVENNLERKYIRVNETSNDTTVEYKRISSIEILENN